MSIGAWFYRCSIVAGWLLLPGFAVASTTLTALPSDWVPPLPFDYRAQRVEVIASSVELSSGRVRTDSRTDSPPLLAGILSIEPGANFGLQQSVPFSGGSPAGGGGSISLNGSGVAVALNAGSAVFYGAPGIQLAQVPEPSSWMLLLAGALLIGGVARRRCTMFS